MGALRYDRAGRGLRHVTRKTLPAKVSGCDASWCSAEPVKQNYLVKATAPAFQVRPRSLPPGKRSSSSRITIP